MPTRRSSILAFALACLHPDPSFLFLEPSCSASLLLPWTSTPAETWNTINIGRTIEYVPICTARAPYTLRGYESTRICLLSLRHSICSLSRPQAQGIHSSGGSACRCTCTRVSLTDRGVTLCPALNSSPYSDVRAVVYAPGLSAVFGPARWRS